MRKIKRNEKRKTEESVNGAIAPSSSPAKSLLHFLFRLLLSLLIFTYRLLEVCDGEKSWHHIKLIDYRKAEEIKLLILSAIDILENKGE